MYSERMSSTARSIRRSLSGILIVTVLILAGKGVSLVLLSRGIGEQAESVAAFYRASIGRHVPGILGAPAIAADEREAANALAEASPPAGPDITANTIVAAQLAYMQLLTAAESGLRSQPAFVALQKDLGKGGAVQPSLDSHNALVQQWNSQKDDLLGRLFVRAFGLAQKLLLQADGTMEYETTVTL